MRQAGTTPKDFSERAPSGDHIAAACPTRICTSDRNDG
ncbi:membrane protein [Cutibacterium acnes JCM 18920]|nr:membrane protein [Cutibacterium acnes JCM 18920]